MGRLNVQNVLSSELARRRFFLRPSEPLASELMGPPGEGIYLGRTATLRTPVYWDFKRLANPHVAVMGMTGSGKSYFVKTFITRAHQHWGTDALILDWAGEYTPWVKRSGGRVVRLGQEHSLNILDLTQAAAPHPRAPVAKKKSLAASKDGSGRHLSASTPRMRIEQVLGALQILTDLGKHPRQAREIKAALERAYAKKHLPLENEVLASARTRRMPVLKDVLSELKSRMPSRKGDEDLEAAVQTIEAFCAPGADYLSREGGVRLDQLVGSGLVSVDLSGLPSEAHRSLAGLTILQFLKERMRAQGWSASRRLELIVVADEAWKIAQDERSDLVAILREGRKYAFGLVVASQNPTDLSKTVLSNAGTVLAFRLMLAEFRQFVGQSMHCPPQTIMEMERYGVGQALVRMAFEKPGPFDGPFVISRIEGEEPRSKWRLEVDKMEIDMDREIFRKRLWRAGCSDAQIQSISEAFESADRSLGVEELSRMLTSYGFERSAILSFLRGLGVPDPQLVKIFARLQARSLGVGTDKVVSLVVLDDSSKKSA
ncbi:MAG: ATP-binding protein [Candidatus Micrarchaeota archaeon]